MAEALGVREVPRELGIEFGSDAGQGQCSLPPRVLEDGVGVPVDHESSIGGSGSCPEGQSCTTQGTAAAGMLSVTGRVPVPWLSAGRGSRTAAPGPKPRH